jgi:hypothetical protein
MQIQDRGSIPLRSTNKNKNNNNMKSQKHLTRFTYKTTDFQGWRLCITKDGHTFSRYFGDKKNGGAKKALAKANQTRKWLKAKIDSCDTLKSGKIGKREAGIIKAQLMYR